MLGLSQQQINGMSDNMTEKTKKKKKTAEFMEVKELLIRTQASFDNYRKQTEKRIKEMQGMASKNVVVELLPVLDNFSLALRNADTNTNHSDFIKGIELIYSQLNTLLQNQGVEPVETINQQFDPYFHEALMKVPSEKAENIIVEEFQRGFTLHGKVIRHAKVKVSAGKKEKIDTNTTTTGGN